LNDPAFLRLIWLASPALPVGGFSYSEGLESAIERGLVADEAGAARWLQDQLSLTLARSELPLLAAALRAWQAQDLPRLHALNDWQLHTRETHELRRQTEQMGRAMLDWLRAHDATDPRLGTLASLAPAPSWPLAFALAAVQAAAPPQQTLLAFGFGWAENLVQAAMKAVPLGQRAGQRVLAQLAGALPGCVESALACGDEARQSYSPMLAIVSALHETQYSRLFRS
jgi:urease accessory protein